MAVASPPTGKYNVIARLFELMNNISEDRLLLILKNLLQDNFTTHIFKLVIDMTDEQQMLLLEALEKKAPATAISPGGSDALYLSHLYSLHCVFCIPTHGVRIRNNVIQLYYKTTTVLRICQ